MKEKINIIFVWVVFVVVAAISVPSVHAARIIKPNVVKKERLVLMPLRVTEEDRSLQGAMETALVEGLQGKYEVFSGDQVQKKAREIFSKESRTAKKECDETRCMQDIAIAFQAELIATTSVIKRPDGYFLALSIQNIFDNKVVYSKSLPCENCNAYKVVNKLKELAGISLQTTVVSSQLPVGNREAMAVAVQVMEPGKGFKDCADCPDMVVIPSGSFDMGSPDKVAEHKGEETNAPGFIKNLWTIKSDDEGRAEEMPLHTVTISKPFAMGKYEVTQEEWQIVMGNNPSYFKNCGRNCPVERVSWDDVQEYIRKLNKKTGKEYRLPSEAEWEYACRADGKYQYCGSDEVNSIAWYQSNSNSITHPVGKMQANAFGLYDMSGNVAELVEDNYHENYNGAPIDGSVWLGDGTLGVFRGGSWFSDLRNLRAAPREAKDARTRDTSYGFRLVRPLQ